MTSPIENGKSLKERSQSEGILQICFHNDFVKVNDFYETAAISNEEISASSETCT